MIDMTKYRVIDLTRDMLPSERKIDGRYLHGEPPSGRPIELQEFIAYGARMHHIQMQSHLGTHAEATYKYDDDGADVASMPLDTYLGEAVACNFTHKQPGTPIDANELKQAGVKAGDIVLLWGAASESSDDWPYLTVEAVDWLIETGIKAISNEYMSLSPPGTPFGQGDADCKLLLAGIGIVDAVVGLDQIKKPRVFLIALPPKMQRVTAFPTRAIVLEER